MIAVAGAAFAVDAFYASVVEHAPETKARSRARIASIFETMKLAFTLRRAQQTLLHEQLTVLFRLRGAAVHPPAGWVEPVLHPVFNVGVEPRFIHYGVENATQAHRLAHRMFWVCLRCPRRKHKELVSWCDGVKPLVENPAP
jgi:hypothetical protein